MFEGVFTALVTPFRDGDGRRARAARAGRAADRGRRRRPRAVRLDRRGGDALARRAPARGRGGRGRGARPRAGAGGHGLEHHRARRSSSRCTRRRPARTARCSISPYYNRPTPGGHRPALRGDRARDRLPAGRLQHPRAHGVEHPARDRRAARRDRAGGRREGVVRRPRTRSAQRDRGDARRLQRCSRATTALTLPMLAIGGDGRDLDRVERGAGRDGGAGARVPRGRRRRARATLHYRLLPLLDALFCETNPIPVKAALATARA